MAETRLVLKFFNRFGANAACRFVDNPFQSQIVAGLQYDAEISQSITNFGAFIEFQSADNLIGNGFGNELFFKLAGLGGGAYQNGDVGVVAMLPDEVFSNLRVTNGRILSLGEQNAFLLLY